MSWLASITAKERPLYGVSVLKSAFAPLAAPVLASKPHVDTNKMCVTSVLTTRTPDRQGDIVDPLGGNFAEHESNPVVMFHHGKDHKLPIGKAEDANGNYTVRHFKSQDGDVLFGTTYFSQTSKFAQDVFGLIAEDVLRGVSIGFDPLQRQDAIEELGVSPILERPALHFKAWKLLEYSHTPIGVNPEALTAIVRKSEDGTREKLHPFLTKVLTPYATPRKTTVTGGDRNMGAQHEKGIGSTVRKVGTAIGGAAKKVGKAAVKGVKRLGTDAGELAETVGITTGKPNPSYMPEKRSNKYGNFDENLGAGGSVLTTKAEDYEDDTGVGDPQDTGVDPGAMPADDDDPGAGAAFDPTTDDPNEDPNLPPDAAPMPDEDNTPPTVRALLDGSQGLMDLATSLEDAMQKGEHPGGRRFGASMCEKLRSLATKMQAQAQGIHSELNGEPAEEAAEPGDTGDEPDVDLNEDEDASEPEEPPPTDDEGAVVTKGVDYSPRRFVFHNGEEQQPVRSAPTVPVPRRVKAIETENEQLKHENIELSETLERLLDDIEAGKQRRRE